MLWFLKSVCETFCIAPFPDYPMETSQQRAITSHGLRDQGASQTPSPEDQLKGYDRMWQELEKRYQPGSS